MATKKLIPVPVAIFFSLFLNSSCVAQKQGRLKIDSLFSILSGRDDTNRVNGLVNLASEYYYVYPDSMIILGEQALNLAVKINFKKGEGNADAVLGVGYWAKGDNETALDNCLKSLQIREAIGDKRSLGNSYDNLGLVYSASGENYKALENYMKALKICEEFNDKPGVAHSYHSIATVLNSMGNYDESLKYHLQCLKIRQELNDKRGLAYSYNSLGIFFRDRGNNKKAIENYTACLNIYQDLDEKLGMANTYTNIANVYAIDGNPDKALLMFLSSLKVYEDFNLSLKVALACNNIGNVYFDKHDYVRSLEYYFKALRIHEQRNNKSGIAYVSNNMGNVYLKMNNLSEAYKMQNRSFSIYKEIGSNEDWKAVLFSISQCDSAAGDWRAAYTNYKLFTSFKDSVDSKENSKNVSEILTKYETEKKEKEIALLKKDQEIQYAEINKQRLVSYSIAGGSGIIILSFLFSFFFYKRKRNAEQKQKETSLSLQVSETEMKALRSQMNPHFIFNALQSIQTFLMSHKPDDANTYLLKFSKLMRLVLENSQHSEVPLKEDMQALELYMQLESIRLPYPFTYEFHIDKSVDVENDTIPPLILQPFVENAIWHGLQYKNESGHINIYISKKDNSLYATVEDNGVGRDMSKQVQQPMLLKKESLGMKLTEERLKILNELKKIKAQFKITDLFTKDNQPAGTKVELSLPLVV
jgi:tetratricopeptide (TPR) repeat protein